MMIQLEVIFLIISCLNSQLATSQKESDSNSNLMKLLHPSIFLVIGIISAVLSMAFVVLAYAKFCPRYPFDVEELEGNRLHGIGRGGGSSGIDQAVIDSLPFFTFLSLKGSKHGLECAVCLSKFEESEVLRLLPKCKHAFHRTCIDEWLLGCSSCPLCRSEIDPKEIERFDSSASMEIFVERDQTNRLGSSRFGFNIGSVVDKLKHRIIVSEVVIKNRWSDVNSSDLLSLSTEMLSDISRRKMSAPINLESADTMIYHNYGEIRSMSEITHFSRSESDSLRGAQGIKEQGCSKKYAREERSRRLWLPIAQRTVHWLASTEDKLKELEFRRHTSEV